MQNEDGLDGCLLNLFLLTLADVFGIEGHLQVCQKLVLTDEFLNDSNLVEGVSPSVLVDVHDESAWRLLGHRPMALPRSFSLFLLYRSLESTALTRYKHEREHLMLSRAK